MGLCMKEKWSIVSGSKSEETLCRLLITMVEETFDVSKSRVNLGKQIMNLRSEYVKEESSKCSRCSKKKRICGPFLIIQLTCSSARLARFLNSKYETLFTSFYIASQGNVGYSIFKFFAQNVSIFVVILNRYYRESLNASFLNLCQERMGFIGGMTFPCDPLTWQ